MEDAENDVVYAGFWLRLCANLIDTIIFVPLIFLFLFIIYGADALLYKEIEVLYLGAWHYFRSDSPLYTCDLVVAALLCNPWQDVIAVKSCRYQNVRAY
jgi:hypothetical protein